MSNPTNTPQGPSGVDYSTWADADLRRRAEERGLGLRPDAARDELIEAVRWSDARSQQTTEARVNATVNTRDYETMTVTELRAEADARGVSLPGRATKAELVDVLEAADGMTEEQQAEQDGVDYDGE